jgi:CRP/FNR family transcriptional regulator, cyclic AMP receptor protein
LDGSTDVLALTAALPTRRLEPGEVLLGPGHGDGRSVAILVEGALRVDLDGAQLAEITVPGSFVGEIGALVGGERTATVVATEATTVRMVGDPQSFFRDDPRLGLELARQLAGRLQRLLAYLGDVRAQYGDQEGHLGVLDAVLGKIASRPPVDIEPGSDRDAGYEA